MTTTNKVLLAAFAIEIALAIVGIRHAMRVAPDTKAPPKKLGAIIRLHIPTAPNHFTCSGTVVSPRVIVTAAHCLAAIGMMTPFGMLLPPNAAFDVRAEDGLPLGVLGKVAGNDPRSDLAVLTGDFSRFETLPLMTDPKGVIKGFMKANPRLKTCGYPYGGPLFCVPLLDPSQYLFQFMAKGYLYPGMSGGPVIDLDTGAVIAVNTAVTASEESRETFVIISPTIDIFDDTETQGLKP